LDLSNKYYIGINKLQNCKWTSKRKGGLMKHRVHGVHGGIAAFIEAVFQ